MRCRRVAAIFERMHALQLQWAEPMANVVSLKIAVSMATGECVDDADDADEADCR